MDNKDQQLKELERAHAKSGAVIEPRESVMHATNRLDQRIAGQRYYGPTDSDTKSKERTSASNHGIKMEPPSKLRAQRVAVAPRPGVNREFCKPNQTELETAKKSKLRAADPTNTTTSRPGLAEQQSDVIVKSPTRPTAPKASQVKSSGRSGNSGSGAASPAGLSNLENTVAANIRAQNLGQFPTTPAASVTRRDLSQLERDVTSKSMARSEVSTPIPVTYFERRSAENSLLHKGQVESSPDTRHFDPFESDHASKQKAQLGATLFSGVANAHENVRDLEKRIADKAGISFHDGRRDDKHIGNDPGAEKAASKMADSTAPHVFSESIQSGMDGSFSTIEMKLHDSQSPQEGFRYGDMELGSDTGDRLAVATAVKERGGDSFIAAAFEYDPDSKPPIFRNRRFRLYCLLACTLIVVMIAGIVGLLSTKTEEGEIIQEVAPTTPPTRSGSLGIEEQIELVVGSEVLADPRSPHSLAKDWILNRDPLKLTSSDVNLVQRYVLAVIYFKLHEEGDWLSCNAPTAEDPGNFCFHQKLVNTFPKEYRSTASSKWLSGVHECTWAGLQCDEFEQLRMLDLLAQDVTGPLPIEFIHFPLLQGINMGWNKIHGTIPPEYVGLSHLLAFELHYNQLSGTIPGQLVNAKNLQILNIASNEITGQLPPQISKWSNLKAIYAFDNMITGTLPTELAELSLLKYIRLQRNFMSGSFPTEFGRLRARELWLHRMPITGTLPSEMGEMDDLVDLRLHSTLITGTIPEELYQLTDLFRLDLHNTGLSGTLSANISKISGLQNLRLRDMNLSGTIPKEVAELSELNNVWFEGNDFTGAVPLELCALRGLNGSITEMVADCLVSPETGETRITCSCCDLCCDHATGVCSS